MTATSHPGITSRPPRQPGQRTQKWRTITRLHLRAFTTAAAAALLTFAVAAGAASASAGVTQPSFAAVRAGYAITGSSGLGAAAPCTGNRRASAARGDIAEVFFYSSAGCIGSVTEYVHYATRSCKDWHIRIYHGSNPHPEATATLRHVCKPAGNYKSTANFHRIFPRPVRVCAGATNTPGYPCRTVD